MGLACDDTVKQILSKLPLFARGQLQRKCLSIVFRFGITVFRNTNHAIYERVHTTRIRLYIQYLFLGYIELMIEPVLQDRREDHKQFCRFAHSLIERVCGQHNQHFATSEVSLDRIRRVRYTSTSYNYSTNCFRSTVIPLIFLLSCIVS